MSTTSRLLASLCCAFMFAGAAYAQTANGANPAPAGDRSVDCDKGSYSSASGTGSEQPLRAHRSHAMAKRGEAMHGNMPSAYAQCLNSNDRWARAQCVRQSYESRYGTSGSLTASSSMRRPC